MKRLLHFLDPIIAIGVIISISLALILVLIGQDQSLSLLIGLTTTAITLMIDIIARLRESEERILQGLDLNTSVRKNPWLFSIVQSIVSDYLSVNDQSFEEFSTRSRTALTECRDVMHGLAEGYMTVDITSPYSFARMGIERVQKSIKATQYSDPSIWRSEYGKKYLKVSGEAVERGVSMTRVWLADLETLTQYYDIIETQQEKGIDVFVAKPTGVPHHLLEDYLIADDRVIYRLKTTLDSKPKAIRISVDPVEVKKAVNDFDLLLRYASSASEFFAAKRNQDGT